MKDQLQQSLQSALKQLHSDGVLPADCELPTPKIDRTRDSSHGDFASNIALSLAKQAGLPPRELADKICQHLAQSPVIARVEIAGPGFINFFIANAAQANVITGVLAQGERYGCSDAGNGQSVQVEFVSANPTGPLHVGHGRGAAIGDSLCRLLEATGWSVTREFYYNDAGAQIDNLALSVQARCKGVEPEQPAWPADGYRGQYIVELAEQYLAGASINGVTAAGNSDDLEAIRQFAVAALRHEQDLDLAAFDVRFDVFSLESSLYTDGKVEASVATLAANGYTYEQDGALWLRTTDFGDDKDRVMRKANGHYTYFVPDVAYHREKWQRGFTRVINEQGADHHSTITRVRAGLQALQEGIPEGWPDYVLHQMVTVMRNQEEVKISKRAGSYVTLRDLIDQVGRDATRYFLAARKADSQLTFDIDLALQQSNDNPVFYIQYAHARVCSMHRQAAEKAMPWDEATALASLDTLTAPAELALMKMLEAYPDRVASSARELAPHQVAAYLRELAAALHSWYATGNQDATLQVLVDNAGLRNARLALAQATRVVLANGLGLLGVSAPTSM